VDRKGVREVRSADLRLEAESAAADTVMAEDDGACDLRARQAPFDPSSGDLVQAWLEGDWADAAIIEFTASADGDAGKNVRVVRLSDCMEAVVPRSRIRRKENYQVHLRRKDACDLAKKKLTKARVTDADVLQVLRCWAFVPNPMRKNVIPDGESWVYSDTLGLVNSRTSESCTKSRLAVVYPEMMQFLGRWLCDNRPKQWNKPFPFTSININFAYAARLHRDGRNAGPSVLRALGSFKGGRLEYFPDDDGKLNVDVLKMLPSKNRTFLDASKKFQLIHGKRAHSVEDFVGERFSVVFFTCGSYPKASPSLRKALVDAGCNWPTKSSMARFQELLHKPRGYSSALRQNAARTAVRCQRKRKREETAPKEPPAKEAATKAKAGQMFQLLRFPHLGLELTLERTYSMPILVKKCKGDRGKLTALRRKLKDPKTFRPVTV